MKRKSERREKNKEGVKKKRKKKKEVVKKIRKKKNRMKLKKVL